MEPVRNKGREGRQGKRQTWMELGREGRQGGKQEERKAWREAGMEAGTE